MFATVVTGGCDRPSDHFEYTRVNSDEPPILVETSTGCTWLLVPNWKVENPKEGQEIDIEAEKGIARDIENYALVSVKTGGKAMCNERFGLGVPHGVILKGAAK